MMADQESEVLRMNYQNQTDKSLETKSEFEMSAEKWNEQVNNYIKNNKITMPNKVILDNGVCTISPTNQESF